jgi:catechol 2,3-dioxygenase-like lactoylglutathione lyase family enzyme
MRLDALDGDLHQCARLCSAVSPELSAITAFRMTTAEPDRLLRFYQGLGFTVGDRERIPDDEIALLGLEHGGTRLPLRLGEQRVDLDSFDHPGRPYPAGATSADLYFQHLALVTDNAAAAWARAVALGAMPISADGPVTLPASSGGVTAVKFRDPEGHPLELLQFPPESENRWRGIGLIGIDHTAISISDAGISRSFYETLGLSVQGPTLNHGPTQEALDGLAGAEVDVVPMMPRGKTPHLELLGYRKPLGGSADPLQANDVAATRIVWAADRDALIRDPDGHLHLLRRSTLKSL